MMYIDFGNATSLGSANDKLTGEGEDGDYFLSKQDISTKRNTIRLSNCKNVGVVRWWIPLFLCASEFLFLTVIRISLDKFPTNE
jgi:hypothetical protein